MTEKTMKKSQTSVTDALPCGAETKPRFGRIVDAMRRYPLGRTSLYKLIDRGLIRSAVIRVRGTERGLRILDLASLEAFLSAEIAAQTTEAQAARVSRQEREHKAALQ
jgi:hypothetical protein